MTIFYSHSKVQTTFETLPIANRVPENTRERVKLCKNYQNWSRKKQVTVVLIGRVKKLSLLLLVSSDLIKVGYLELLFIQKRKKILLYQLHVLHLISCLVLHCHWLVQAVGCTVNST